MLSFWDVFMHRAWQALGAHVSFKWANECYHFGSSWSWTKIAFIAFLSPPTQPQEPASSGEARLGEGACWAGEHIASFRGSFHYSPFILFGDGWYLQKQVPSWGDQAGLTRRWHWSGAMRMSRSDRSKANLRIAGEPDRLKAGGGKKMARAVRRIMLSLWDVYIYIYMCVCVSLYIHMCVCI